MYTCMAMNFFAASVPCLPICLGSMILTTISPCFSTASRAAAVDASWSFSMVSSCLKISFVMPLTCNSDSRSCESGLASDCPNCRLAKDPRGRSIGPMLCMRIAIHTVPFIIGIQGSWLDCTSAWLIRLIEMFFDGIRVVG